ncbi:hypothetical protein P7D73_21975 [Enterococcus raffinosus]|uniref:hypothetical protein n=1 Tax=Enterococcus raffinosus TaxID=71452 RepID=UPI00288DABF0|nr:hypothetical protein [Enterococcus raffinosus]MDT2525100.1 hypothetical protein [Enterococcus raffinosus]MDT2593213.1 hypothetical protein [Enterococcus raffinosus]
MDKSELKIEAIERMKALGIYMSAVNLFEKYNIVSVCPHLSYGANIPTDSNEKLKEVISNIEDKTGGLVYYILETPYQDFNGSNESMEMFSFFFVPKNKNEWELDREDLQSNTQLIYGYNAMYPDFSEFGEIMFKKINGGLQRIS